MATSNHPNTRVIVTGTDPERPRGGIGVAMSGYLEALRRAELLEGQVITYRPDRADRHAWMALSQAPALVRAIRSVRERGEDPVVYAHPGGDLSILRETALLGLARRTGARTMVQLHSLRVQTLLEHPSSRRLLLRAIRGVDVVCALTPYWRSLLSEHHPGRIEVVPNPLPPYAEAQARRAPPRSPSAGPIHALTMTRLVQGKGVDLALRAVAAGPTEVRLTVAGDGPERSRLEALASELGIRSRVTFAGWIGDEQKLAALRAADVFLLPTRLDSFGMGFVEAACFGMPAIALRWGAIPDIVLDGQSGWLASDDQDAVAGLAAALHQACNRESLARRGERARLAALERFSIEAVSRCITAALPA